MKKTNVEESMLKEVLKNCSLHERIIVRIFDKEFVKVYNVARINVMNDWLNCGKENQIKEITRKFPEKGIETNESALNSG